MANVDWTKLGPKLVAILREGAAQHAQYAVELAAFMCVDESLESAVYRGKAEVLSTLADEIEDGSIMGRLKEGNKT